MHFYVVLQYTVCLSQSLTVTKRVKEMCSVVPDVKHTILLIGGGENFVMNVRWKYSSVLFNRQADLRHGSFLYSLKYSGKSEDRD